MDDRTNLLQEQATNLRTLAEALEMAAEILQQHEVSHTEENHQPTAADPKPEDTKEITLTLTDVRKILAEKSRAGYTDQVRLLLEKYGADKLSAIAAANYQNLVSEAECLGATQEDLKAAIAEKTAAGLGEWIPGVFKHHCATSLEDLKPEHYAGCLRDVRRLGHE